MPQNNPSFGAIQGQNFDNCLNSLLTDRFGLKKAREILAERNLMDAFADFFAGLKAAVAHSDAEPIKWVDPIIDIERKNADTFTICARLADSLNSTTKDLNINSLKDNPNCLYQILEAIEVPVNQLHQTNGHIIKSFEDESDLVLEHLSGNNPFDKNYLLKPLPQTEEDASYYLTPEPLQKAS